MWTTLYCPTAAKRTPTFGFPGRRPLRPLHFLWHPWDGHLCRKGRTNLRKHKEHIKRPDHRIKGTVVGCSRSGEVWSSPYIHACASDAQISLRYLT